MRADGVAVFKITERLKKYARPVEVVPTLISRDKKHPPTSVDVDPPSWAEFAELMQRRNVRVYGLDSTKTNSTQYTEYGKVKLISATRSTKGTLPGDGFEQPARACVRACVRASERDTTATMEPSEQPAAAAGESWSSVPATKGSSCLEVSMPRKFREEARRARAPDLNWAMCALCVASLAVSGVLYYRELGLESRIANLEARCSGQQLSPPLPSDALLVQTGERLAAKSNAVFRIKRDVAECNCPQVTTCPVKFQAGIVSIVTDI
ncbi:hypothetical protein EAI_09913 [Harpegnathos saltator]|uniref:Uncharacterized protein n=1 Tax=Harpegnathos saltator TaxID=610380 RepID=E2BEY7_HARSA|nr:hypothetical protein EAI_09913 [Harpegnathos saltator]